MHRAELDEDLPANGAFYCQPCSRYFVTDAALALHTRTKPHKRRRAVVAACSAGPPLCEAHNFFCGAHTADKPYKPGATAPPVCQSRSCCRCMNMICCCHSVLYPLSRTRTRIAVWGRVKALEGASGKGAPDNGHALRLDLAAPMQP